MSQDPSVPLIRKIQVQNFGCLKDVTLELTPLHALIGPNDSGKSTVLRAVRAAAWLGAWRYAAESAERNQRVFGLMQPGTTFRLDVAHGFGCAAEVRDNGVHIRWWTGPDEFEAKDLTPGQFDPGSRLYFVKHLRSPGLEARLQRVDVFGFEPDQLRQATPLIPDGQEVRFGTDRGFGLASVLDAIRNRGDDAFDRIRDGFKRLFTTVKNVQLKNVDASRKALQIELVGGQTVPAEFMSEGMLYYIALACLQFITPPAVLLLEEPENGLHPARIHDVVGVLREISKTTQVLLTTHSPLLLNELQGNEVTVLTRDGERGTKATRMDRTANFAERSKVYALGELWVSSADGNLEAPLFSQKAPT